MSKFNSELASHLIAQIHSETEALRMLQASIRLAKHHLVTQRDLFNDQIRAAKAEVKALGAPTSDEELEELASAQASLELLKQFQEEMTVAISE